jgi:hypothetical protein
MKLHDIVLRILREQPEPQDGDQIDNPQDGQENPQDGGQEPQDGEQPVDNEPQTQQPVVKKQKPLSPVEKVKIKWLSENPHLNDFMMDGIIESFNGRKNNLRALVDPNSAPTVRNMAEIYALKQRFPDFPAEDVQKLKDIQTYTWEQIEFLMDRFNTTEAAAEVDFSIDGDTPDDRKRSALQKWDNSYNKLIDENNIVVYKIEGKDEAIALGRLQHILVEKYGGSRWCVTLPPGSGGNNLYTGYRDRRSFYFVLDKNKSEDDVNYISALQVVDMSKNSYEGPFVVTPRPNGDQMGKSWENVVAIWPALQGKENMFRIIPLSKKEQFDGVLDRIRFYPNPQNPPAANDFAIQSRAVQEMYVDSPNRIINDPRSFMTLSEDLQKKYVATTTLDNYKSKYKNLDESKPFGMLEALGSKNLRFLDAMMKSQLGIKDGVLAVKASILRLNYTISYGDSQNDSIKMFISKIGQKYGIMDLDTIEWVKPLNYIRTKAETYFTPEDRKLYVLQRYTNEDGSDYFYWLFPKENLTSRDKSSSSHLKGKFLTKEEGDNIPNSYRKLGE